MSTFGGWLSRLAGAMVAPDLPSEPLLPVSVRALQGMPPIVRTAFVFLLALLWALGTWGTGRRREDRSARWVGAMVLSRVTLIARLGVWVKITACLVAYAPIERRRNLYDNVGLTRPDASKARHGVNPPFDTLGGSESGQDADYLVVGTGPSGATVARTLARSGATVLMLEEGPSIPKQWSATDTLENLHARMRSKGYLSTTDLTPLLQGVCVGGSSVVNSAITWRAPSDVFQEWRQDPGLRRVLTEERIERAYGAIEDGLHITRTAPDTLGPNNHELLKAAERLGWDAQPTDRYAQDCEGSGRCLEGCPFGHKKSMNLTFVPDALDAGAQLLSHCRVEQVLFKGRRAVGVRARLRGRSTILHAKRGVVLAASTVFTPILLRASGVRHRWLGKRFQAHPGVSIVGILPEPVRETWGATQGAEIASFRNEGFKIETLGLPDELLMARFPGTGTSFAKSLEDLPHAALWAAEIKAKAWGTVSGSLSAPRVRYQIDRSDARLMGNAMRRLGELFVAAEARYVYPGVRGLPWRVETDKLMEVLPEVIAPQRVNMILSHMFGAAVMGGDPATAVCDPHGRVFDTEGLWVADSSLFPTNLGVNPQHTIMAIAQHVAWSMVE